MANNWVRYNFEVISSTNDWALENSFLAKNDAIICTADCQTKGRGRRGREWISEIGNLYMSQLFRSSRSPIEMVYIASLSVVQALNELATSLEIQIKWPNDILVQGKKIGGILIERAFDGAWVIGLGLNLSTAPMQENIIYPTSSLSALGELVKREDFINKYLLIFDDNMLLPFTKIKEKWLSHAYRLNEEIIINGASSKESGRFIGIDEQGFLLLQQDNDVKVMNTGEILFA